MSDPKDQIHFNSSAPVPDAGIYRTPMRSAKSEGPSELPPTSSRILNAPNVQNTYASFGLEGLKSILLQELVQLEMPQLQDEMSYLAEGANSHRDIKRALRATKLLASQWLEDPRQPEEIKNKCEFIFNSISTFGTIQIQAPETPADHMTAAPVLFPSMAPLEQVPAEAEHQLSPGTSILLVTDIQGHYERLEQLLLNTQLAQIREGTLHWTAPEGMYLVVVGDLFNKSPYSSWGDGVGPDTYKVVSTLRRFMQISPERILLAYGAQDLDIATRAALDHPLSGFLGSQLGVNAQAQALPAMLSFVRGSGDPESPDFAWEHDPDSQSYQLKEEFQVQGFPKLILPEAEAGPDLTPLTDFYDKLMRYLTQPQSEKRPRKIAEIDAYAKRILPPISENLDLSQLGASQGRCLHYEGLLQGCKVFEFLRNQIAGMHILHLDELELFAMHPEVQEITLDMLIELKPRGAENWQPRELTEFVKTSRTLVQRRIDPEKLLLRLKQLKLTSLNAWLSLSEKEMYARLIQSKQMPFWVPEIITRRDEKGFLEAYRSLRWDLINEDRTGLAGFAINMDALSRRGEPLMRKMAALDERTQRSYTRTFLMDLFREDLKPQINVQDQGIIVEYPNSQNPSLVISLLIHESVAIYRDPKDNLHMPVKHAAWIEFHG